MGPCTTDDSRMKEHCKISNCLDEEGKEFEEDEGEFCPCTCMRPSSSTGKTCMRRFSNRFSCEIHEEDGGGEDEGGESEEHEEGEPFPYVTRGKQFLKCPTGEEQEEYEREGGEGGDNKEGEESETFPCVEGEKQFLVRPAGEEYDADGEDEGGEEREDKEDEESDLSDSEINEYKEAVHKLLKYRAYKIKGPQGQFKCPFCCGMENQKYNTLLNHAIRVGQDSRGSAKQRANHFAMARYLVIDLAGDVPQGAEKILCNLTNEIVGKENLDQLQEKYMEKTMSVHRILEEKAETQHTLFEETRNVLGIVRDQLKGVLEQQEMLNFDFKNKKRRLNSWSEELNKREVALNHEKTKMQEKNDLDLLYQHLLAKECRLSNEELRGVHKELVKGLEDMPNHCRVNIGVKRSSHVAVSELWNFPEDRKATPCEVIRYIFAQWKTLQCKRDEIDEVVRSLF